MNANTHNESSVGKVRVALLLALAMVATTVACSNDSKPQVSSSPLPEAKFRPAAMKTAVPVEHSAPAAAEKSAAPARPAPSALKLFRTRNYGVSFQYPWQYAYVNAKTIANGGPELQPKSDGHDGQFTLVRIDIPHGYYADTDFESGYFALSLNRDLTQEQCAAVLTAPKDVKVQSEMINGVEFRWLETESGGRGHADRVRQYVTFANATCYELELGVKTSNEGGLAREVDPDQVMRRLEAILRTVTIQPDTSTAEVKSATAVAPETPQN